MESMKIGLIGTGNVAWHLARAFENAGHIITEVVARNKESARSFAQDFYQATDSSSYDLRNAQANIFIMAISDKAIEPVSQELILANGTVLAHTSGAVSLNKLGYAQTESTGVFYPLQTFSKGKKTDLSTIPICIEGSSDSAESILKTLAESITNKVKVVDSDSRKSIHLAAVFACNFSNHMFSLAKEIMKEQNLDFELLQPLIAETLNKSLEIGPNQAQTGPAKRKDLETLDQQYKALNNDPEVAEIYRLISQHIIDYYSD